MKKLKFVTMACCVAAMGLTSCLNDSDDTRSDMSKEEVAYCFNAVRGTYEGNLIYVAKNVKDVNDNTDTLKISWNIANDSTMTIKNFPTRLLTDNISDEKLKAADPMVWVQRMNSIRSRAEETVLRELVYS